MSRVDLGFSQECEPYQVESYQFPSKIGGKPAWLDLEGLPSPENLQCECKKPMIFLCQIYAPFEEDELNFHRTVFIFICRDANCCVRNSSFNVKAFRCSLPRRNKFYSFEPPEKRIEFSLDKYVNLCRVCGCRGEKQCGKCHKVRYCSREHQVIDWKGHKIECGSDSQHEIKKTSQILFPQFEIVIEPEEFEENRVDAEEELEKFVKLKCEGKVGMDVSDSEIEKYFCDNNNDKAFRRFQKRIADNNEQVLRYERNGQVLWIADNPKVDTIPKCEYCNSPRQFEFQIMPQMLTVLHEHELDIGIIAVYTCAKSCIPGDKYKKEFVFKQDVTINAIR